MKGTSGIWGSHFGAGLIWAIVLASLALGIVLALLFAAGPAAADGPYGFLVPIVLEETRDPPKHVQREGGAGVRQTIPPATRPVNDNTVNCDAGNTNRNLGVYVHTGYYRNTGNPICEYRPRTPGWGYTLCSQAPTWQTINPATGKAVGGSATKHFSGHYTASGQPICSDFDGLQSTSDYLAEQHKKNHP